MVPTNTVFNRMLQLLGADTLTVGTVATPTNCTVMLIKQAFVPSAQLRLADLVEADFPGYVGPKTALSSPFDSGVDPSNGNTILAIPPNVGGYIWETTSPPSPAQTIYGYAVVGHGPEIVGSALINPPVVLNGTGQRIEIPSPQFKQIAGSIV